MNKYLLSNARSEILRLRHEVEILSARNDVVEVFATALGMRRGGQQGMCTDIAWEIGQELERIGNYILKSLGR